VHRQEEMDGWMGEREGRRWAGPAHSETCSGHGCSGEGEVGGGPPHFACSLLVRTGWPCPGASWPLRSRTWPCWLQEEEERSQRISLPSSSWTFPYSLQYRAMLRSNLTLFF
jgi:hypothetical protein